MQRAEHRPFLRPRVWLGVTTVAALLTAGALALSPTQGPRSVLAQLQRAAVPARTAGAGRTARFIRHSTAGYWVAVTLTPDRADGPIGVSLRVLRHRRPISGAHVHVVFSMPSMHMWNAYTAALSPTRGGLYVARIPVLGMAGRWRLRIDLAPRPGRPFRVTVDDRIVA